MPSRKMEIRPLTRIVLTADPTQMSEYWGIPLLPFFSCAPAEKVPRFVFDLLSPSVKHEGGVATTAPYGLRKSKASLLGYYHPQDIVMARPHHVDEYIGRSTC